MEHVVSNGGELFGYVGSKFITINVGINSSTGHVALYRGGWNLSNYIGMVDNVATKMRILKRGWFKTKVLLTFEGEDLVPLWMRAKNVPVAF